MVLENKKRLDEESKQKFEEKERKYQEALARKQALVKGVRFCLFSSLNCSEKDIRPRLLRTNPKGQKVLSRHHVLVNMIS